MSEKAEEWLIEQIRDHGLEPLAFAFAILGFVIFGAGYIVGWRLTQKKTRTEIEQLKLANRKASGEIVKDLAGLRKEFNNEKELLDMSFATMRETVVAFKEGKKSKSDLVGCRDQMCSIYQNRYLPAITTYAESAGAQCSQPEARIRAKSDLIGGLHTMCKFVEMANLREMLSTCDASPFKLRRESRDALFDRVGALLPWWCLKLRWKIRKLRARTDSHLRDGV